MLYFFMRIFILTNMANISKLNLDSHLYNKLKLERIKKSIYFFLVQLRKLRDKEAEQLSQGYKVSCAQSGPYFRSSQLIINIFILILSFIMNTFKFKAWFSKNYLHMHTYASLLHFFLYDFFSS